MALVSITRLKVRAWWLLPNFFWHALRSTSHARTSAGFLGGGTAIERGFAFWTTTVWADEAAMRGFRNSGAHMKAMPRLIEICDEASYGHWQQDGDTPPTLDEMHRKMLELGKPSKVRRPSAFHQEGKVATERLPGGFRAIKPIRALARQAS